MFPRCEVVNVFTPREEFADWKQQTTRLIQLYVGMPLMQTVGTNVTLERTHHTICVEQEQEKPNGWCITSVLHPAELSHYHEIDQLSRDRPEHKITQGN